MPAMPMAMSVWPSRHARPNVSRTMTATSTPAGQRTRRGSPRAEASESTGSSTSRPCAPLDDWSTPLLAHTKPWWVSVISTGPSWRTMRFASRSTTSMTAGSLSHGRRPLRWRTGDGSTSASSTVRPSALDTIFDVTTTTSPSASGVPAAAAACGDQRGRGRCPARSRAGPGRRRCCRPGAATSSYARSGHVLNVAAGRQPRWPHGR